MKEKLKRAFSITNSAFGKYNETNIVLIFIDVGTMMQHSFRFSSDEDYVIRSSLSSVFSYSNCCCYLNEHKHPATDLIVLASDFSAVMISL